MNEYLWDRTGSPDLEITELEHLLAPLAHSPARPPRCTVYVPALAACIALCALALGMLRRAEPSGVSGWTIAGARELHTGEQILADRDLVLESENVGRLELRAGSEMQVASTPRGRQRMQLRRGHMHALIWAPPAQFVVDTPSARAVDLGCMYDLDVDAAGDGLLKVQTGWVAFQAGAHESFIPSGAACRTSRRNGPGLPYFETAAPPLIQAIALWDRTSAPAALEAILAHATPTDALTLWHLLDRAPAADRPAVFDRFAALVPLNDTTLRSRVMAREPAAIDACWNAVGLNDAAFWRDWKRRWR